MIEEFTTTIKAQLYERVSSPLLSSFLISWCCWNYKFILIIISGIPAMEKLIFIELNIFPDMKSVVFNGVALPLITSLFLIFVYPKPAEFIYRHVKMNQRRLKEIQQSIDDESPISKEQARKIRREALENQLKYEAEIDSKTSENIRLKELVAELQMSLNTDAETRSSDGQRADDVVENNPDIKNIKSSESESSAELSHEQYSKTERLNNRFKDLFSSVSSFHGFSQPRSVNELPLGENDKYYSAVHTLVKQLMNSGESDDTIREQLLGVGVSSQMINRVYSGINNKGGRG